MELIINKQELTDSIESIKCDHPSFDNPQDEIIWILNSHKQEEILKDMEDQEDLRKELSDKDIKKDLTITFKDSIDHIIKIITRIIKGDIYDKEDTHWVTPYDANNDTLYFGKMTKKELNSIKKKWNV